MKVDLKACVVRLSEGERLSAELAGLLDPVNIAGIHWFHITPDRPTEMHYHDNDEYWLFTGGETTVTLRLEDGTSKESEIAPNTLIVTPRGVEHGHVPRTDVHGFEWSSVLPPGAKKGHLQR